MKDSLIKKRNKCKHEFRQRFSYGWGKGSLVSSGYYCIFCLMRIGRKEDD